MSIEARRLSLISGLRRYEVEAIRSHRYLKTVSFPRAFSIFSRSNLISQKLLMVVKWKGYPEDQNTEESEAMMRE
jgi:Chromo (CHRromatin Organisation MOdifier) domain